MGVFLMYFLEGKKGEKQQQQESKRIILVDSKYLLE